MKKDPKERLGSENGAQDILNHPWFKDFDPVKMYSKGYTPEFKPTLSKDKLDVSNFDKMFTDGEAAHSVLD